MTRTKTPRKKQLGAMRYSEAYEDAHERLIDLVEETNHAMKMGFCLNAGESIDKAYVEYGKMLALSTEPQQVAFNKQAFKSIKLADAPFEAKCVRKHPEGSGLGAARAFSEGAVQQVSGRWFFVTTFNGKSFRYEFDPSMENPPEVGDAEMGGAFGANGLAAVLQHGVPVGWFRGDQPAMTR